LSLSKRRGPWGFNFVWEAWTMEAGLSVFDDTNSNEQRSAKTWHEIMRMFAFVRKFWRTRRGLYLARVQYLISPRLVHRPVHHHFYLWKIECDDRLDPWAVQKEVPPP
jgi:hypothetical protein